MKRIAFSVLLLLIVGWTVYDTLYATSETQDSAQGDSTGMVNDSNLEQDENEETEQSIDELITEEGDKTETAKNQGEHEGESIGPAKGDKAPDFTLETLSGEKLSLSDLKGKKVILNMWATWCPPCRAEMPDMQKFYNDYGEEVEIVAVNLTQTETSQDRVDQFVEDFGITFPVVLDKNSDVARDYYAVTIPTSYVIDSKGIIRNKIIGPMSYEWMKEAVGAIQ
jgi:thiol-disulfide isomerase/thioredoxin